MPNLLHTINWPAEKIWPFSGYVVNLAFLYLGHLKRYFNKQYHFSTQEIARSLNLE